MNSDYDLPPTKEFDLYMTKAVSAISCGFQVVEELHAALNSAETEPEEEAVLEQLREVHNNYEETLRMIEGYSIELSAFDF